ncbi:hypothetical protein [Klebsiella aerogenes]|uniref:hypothetical protein n=1 Tax=Klebsiella aerogenes TaxID=548 RepID=UPI00128E769A|nr:hypothetical protein [Klebsiella aerogenes]
MGNRARGYIPPEMWEIVVIRPTTVRNEWKTTSRGPLNEYVDTVSKMLAERGYHSVSVADLNERAPDPRRREWIDDVVPFAHQQLYHRSFSNRAVSAGKTVSDCGQRRLLATSRGYCQRHAVAGDYGKLIGGTNFDRHIL